ncbi:MAG: TIR domain-containing protein [Verrucomicrobia bacterium]|nr:MAG: TIR domain-containing protein [Verrucomicrobiota bacterium]
MSMPGKPTMRLINDERPGAVSFPHRLRPRAVARTRLFTTLRPACAHGEPPFRMTARFQAEPPVRIPATLRMPPRPNQRGRPRSDAPPAMSDEFPYDVFLSHSAKDKAVVRAVAERLRKDGMRVWFDEWEIKGGDSTR